MRPCLGTPNNPCTNLTRTTRCPTCTQAWDRNRRPNAWRRGYNTTHKQARRALEATLPTLCGYGCGTLLTKDTRWMAAHRVDGDPTQGWLASCPSCNERAKR